MPQPRKLQRLKDVEDADADADADALLPACLRVVKVDWL